MKRLVLGLTYVGVMAAETMRSYHDPIYRFHGTGLMLVLSVLGVLVTMAWWRSEIRPRDWWLPAVLVVTALASFPDTSRDHLRYLFDGEMIRLWHLSPYVHLPGEFPLDQYTRPIGSIWWTSIPSPYGPLWQAVMAGVNWLSGNSIVVGVILLKALNVAALLASARYMYLISGKRWVSYLLLINPVVLINTAATPHTDIVIAAALLAAYYHRNTAGRGALLAGAGLIKFHALIFAPFYARSWRELWKLGLWTAGILTLALLMLQPLVGFEWLPMLMAGQGGGVTATVSLLAYTLLPGVPQHVLFMASYGLFLMCYATIAALYIRRKLSPLAAMACVSLLVPLCLTGVLLPWHFLLPIIFLLLNDRPLAYWGVLFITLLVLRSMVTVPELLVLAGLAAGGGWIVYRAYQRHSRPPKFAALVLRFLR